MDDSNGRDDWAMLWGITSRKGNNQNQKKKKNANLGSKTQVIREFVTEDQEESTKNNKLKLLSSNNTLVRL